MINYMLLDEYGTAFCDGVSELTYRRVAQDRADRLGVTVWAVASDAPEDDDGERFEPRVAGPVAICYANGARTEYDSYAAALEEIRESYGEGAVTEHDGDLTDGGNRTLVWATEEDSIDDDGARAVASIYRAS